MQSSISATVRRRSIDEGHDSPPREGENSSAVIFAQSRDQASTMDAACPFGAFSSSPGADVHLDEAPLTAIHTEGKGPVMERAEEAMAAEESLGDGPSEAPEEKPAVEEKRHRRASKQLPPSAEIDAASPLDWQMKVRPILCAHMRDPVSVGPGHSCPARRARDSTGGMPTRMAQLTRVSHGVFRAQRTSMLGRILLISRNPLKGIPLRLLLPTLPLLKTLAISTKRWWS